MVRRLLAAFMLVVIPVAVVIGVSVHARQMTAEQCGEGPWVEVGSLRDRLRLKAPLKPEVIPYGSERGVRYSSVFLELLDEVPKEQKPLDHVVAVSQPRLEHEGTGEDFPASLVVAQAKYSPADQGVTVTICTDLQESGQFDPGRYTGSVKVTDSRFNTEAISLQIDIKDTKWGLAMLAALLGGVGGAVWGSLSTLVSTWEGKAKTPEERADRRRMIVTLGLLSLLVGLTLGLLFWLFNYVDAVSFEAKWYARRDLAVLVFAAGVSMHPVVALVERVLRNLNPSDGGERESDQ